MQVDVEYNEQKKQIKSQKIKLEPNNQIKQEMEAICKALEIKEPVEEFCLQVKSSGTEIPENILVKHAFIKYNLRNETVLVCRKPVFFARYVLSTLDPKTNNLPQLKSIVFQLKGHLANSSEFAEEFIVKGGIQKLLDVVMNTKGSTQAYALSALAEALTYVDGMEAVLSVPDIVVKLWGLLSSKVVSVQRSALEVLIVICHLCGDLRGFNLLHTAAKQDAAEKGKEPYECLVGLLSSKGDWETALNALTLLNLILVVCPSEHAVQQLITNWEKNFKINQILKTEIAKMQQEEFHIQLDIYETVTGTIVRSQTDRLLHENMKLQKKLQRVEKQMKKKIIVKSSNTDKEKEQAEMDQLRTEIMTHTIMRETPAERRKSVRQTINFSALGVGILKAKQGESLESIIDPETAKLLQRIEQDDQERMALRRRVKELEYLVAKLRGDDPDYESQSLEIDLEKTIPHIRSKRGASTIPKKDTNLTKNAAVNSAEKQSSSSSSSSTAIHNSPPLLSSPPHSPPPSSPRNVDTAYEVSSTMMGIISDSPFRPLASQTLDIIEPISNNQTNVLPKSSNRDWIPIMKLSERKSEKTIWDMLGQINVSLPDLEIRFGSRAEENPKDALSESRIREINWLLAKYPQLSNMTKIIDELNDEKTPLSLLKILEKIVPTPDEVEFVKKKNIEQLSNAEKFVLDVASIPLLREQLQCWLFKKEYPFLIENIAAALSILQNAIRTLQNSSSFRQLLSIVLFVGNKLYGTNAIGFRIDFLNRLKQIYDVYHQTSLLEYVLQIAEEKFEEFSDRLQLELMDSFEKASKVRLKEVKENLNDLQTHYKSINDILENYSRQKSQESLFYQEFYTFLSQIRSEIELLETSLQNTEKMYIELMLSFGYETESSSTQFNLPNSESFFGSLQEFLNDVIKVKETLVKMKARTSKVSISRSGFRGKIGAWEQTASDIVGKLKAGEGVYRLKKRNSLFPVESRTRRETTEQGNIAKERKEETKEANTNTPIASSEKNNNNL